MHRFFTIHPFTIHHLLFTIHYSFHTPPKGSTEPICSRASASLAKIEKTLCSRANSNTERALGRSPNRPKRVRVCRESCKPSTSVAMPELSMYATPDILTRTLGPSAL